MYIRSEGQNDAGDLVQLEIIMRKTDRTQDNKTLHAFHHLWILCLS